LKKGEGSAVRSAFREEKGYSMKRGGEEVRKGDKLLSKKGINGNSLQETAYLQKKKKRARKDQVDWPTEKSQCKRNGGRNEKQRHFYLKGDIRVWTVKGGPGKNERGNG